MDFQLAQWVHQYGYLAVLVGSFLEGETILALAGFAAHQGQLQFPLVLLIAFVAGFAGDQVFFWFGRVSGPPLLRRHAPLALAAERVGVLLQRHDAALIFGIRFMYGLRIAGPVAMGSLGVDPGRFALFNALGAAVWAPVIGGAGYLFGHALQAWLGDAQRYEVAALAAIIAAALTVSLVHHLRARRVQPRD